MEPVQKKLKPPPAKAAKVAKPADLAEVFAGEKWLPKKSINALFTSLVENSENFNDALKKHVPNVVRPRASLLLASNLALGVLG